MKHKKIKTGLLKQTIEKEYFFVECPICKEKMKGSSKGMAIYNFSVHFSQKHPTEKLGDYVFEQDDKKLKCKLKKQ